MQIQPNRIPSKTGAYLPPYNKLNCFLSFTINIINVMILLQSWLYHCQTFYGKFILHTYLLSNSLHWILSKPCLLVNLSFKFKFFISPFLFIQMYYICKYIQQQILSRINSKLHFFPASFHLLSVIIQLPTIDCLQYFQHASTGVAIFIVLV